MNTDPTRTDGAAQRATYGIPNNLEGWADGLSKLASSLSAAAPVSATVEQRHRNLAEHIYNTYGIDCPKERQSIYENDIAVLLADFESKAVAQATAEMQKVMDEVSRVNISLNEIVRNQAKKLRASGLLK